MSRTYGLAALAGLATTLAGWAAIALAQGPGNTPPAPAPVAPAPFPVLPVNSGSERPGPAPVMPAQPGTVPTPVAPAVPQPATPAPNPQAQGAAAQPAPAADQPQPAAPAADAALDPGNPTGRQEPAVSIEWMGPATAKVGQPTDYTVLVRNACNIPVQQVLVRVRLSTGASVIATEPNAVTEDNILMWEVGTLLPKQEKTLQMRLMSPARGDVAAQAWVTFTGSTAMRIKVREPKLAVKATAPDKVMVGDTTSFTLTVSNPGDGMAEMVKLHADLSDGLENPRGKKVDYDLGNLNPGESRSVVVICNAKGAGEQSCFAAAEADIGLKAQDKAVANVIMPRLDLEVKGPKLRYLDRKAVYTFKVTNPGDAPAVNVTLTDALPAGFKFVQADMGGRHDFATRSVSWFLGEMPPGQSREVNMEVVCVSAGEFVHKLTAQASRGLKVEGEMTTRVEGLSAIQLEMVDLEDPVEINGETIYEIRITNTGTKTETDLKLVCTLPADKMQFKAATGPSGYHAEGAEIVFDPLPKLAPRADAIYRVTVKCTTPGVAHFKARITSAVLTEPVTKEEATRIYTD
jgi:uncharacterized repeat protein (TIGR01451 family)